MAESVLARYQGVKVFTAVRRSVDLEMAGHYRPEVMLLELHLPDIFGEEVLRQLRLNPATSHIPGVIIDADAVPERAETQLSAGACGFMKKPLEITSFLQMLRDCRNSPDTNASLSIDAVL